MVDDMRTCIKKSRDIQGQKGKITLGVAVCILAVFLCGPSSLYGIQSGNAQKLTKNIGSPFGIGKNLITPEKREISLNANNAPLLSVLKRLAKKARVGISYQKEMIPDKKVTVHVKGVSVYQALQEILKGTGLKAVLPFSRDVLVIKKKELKADIQQATVSGTVTDAQTGNTIPGVNILVKGTSTGTATDNKGHYSLNVPSLQDTLRFSYIGYETKNVPINGRTSINVSLSPTTLSGKEMVVVGFQKKRKSEITGAVSQIEGKKLESQPTNNTTLSLEGNVAGLMVNDRGGPPGENNANVLVGGVSTLGDSSPLFVIDGVPRNEDAFARLSAGDIESISVLKGASAAIYGARGANGVIIVQTKEGNRGKSVFSVGA
jgi:TonB-dependent SusC/RagA subfamily outer membrane receptor